MDFLKTMAIAASGLRAQAGRMRVISENLANADTPSYRGRDLVAPKFDASPQVAAATVSTVALVRTESNHIAGVGQSDSAFRTLSGGNYEIRPTGNAVNLEEEMIKVATNQMDYQAATALYTRSLNLIKIALGKR